MQSYPSFDEIQEVHQQDEIVMATVFTFIFEPIKVWLDIYQVDNWKIHILFAIYIIKAVFVKWLVDEVIIKKELEFK